MEEQVISEEAYLDLVRRIIVISRHFSPKPCKGVSKRNKGKVTVP